jgi:hypothetical protein
MLGWKLGQAGTSLKVTGRAGRAMEAMLAAWQAQQKEVVLTLARVRSAMRDVRVELQRAVAEHERMAVWYAEHGNEDAAWVERRTAEVQRQRLAEMDAAFHGLEDAVSAAVELDP